MGAISTLMKGVMMRVKTEISFLKDDPNTFMVERGVHILISGNKVRVSWSPANFQWDGQIDGLNVDMSQIEVLYPDLHAHIIELVRKHIEEKEMGLKEKYLKMQKERYREGEKRYEKYDFKTISQLIEELEAIKEKTGDIPVVVAGHNSNSVECEYNLIVRNVYFDKWDDLCDRPAKDAAEDDVNFNFNAVVIEV